MESNAHARTPPQNSNPAHRASTRYSTFSLNAPTLAPSIAPSHLSRDGRSPTPTEKAPRSHSAHRSSHHHHKQQFSDSATAAPRASSAPTSAPGSSAGSTSTGSGGWDGTVYSVRAALARLEEPRLSSQRYVVSEEKRTEFGALALAAKLEKALGRRMSGQDASFRSAPRSRSASGAGAAASAGAPPALRKKVVGGGGGGGGSISLADAPGVSRVTARALKA